ncbi:MAG TPA: ATP-binding protein [Mycobacteriales bacterium]|nr:ATP-binding protein [Mycobacteriales bacterium]
MPNPVLAARGLAARTPLRIKLVAAFLVLAAAGLTLTAFAATAALRSYLLNRLDDQLATAAGPIANRAGGFNAQPDRYGAPPGGSATGSESVPSSGSSRTQPTPSAFYVAFIDPSGRIDAPPTSQFGVTSPPKLPTLTTARLAALHGKPFTVSSRDGHTSWRVVAHELPDDSGGIVVATSMTELNHTVTHLILLELVIGGLVLVLMGGGGYLLIRRSLRPLVEVEHTAEAIAAGDLTRRVTPLPTSTELGRLSDALNSMLGQIETAFAKERDSQRKAKASEDKMRQFVADASHELRTPLTSIRGFAELHRMGATTDEAEVARLMRRVEDEAARMGVLVDDLLLLARLDQQRPLEQAPVDLLEIASDVVHDARVVAPDRAIDLKVSTTSPPVVIGDELRLRQVVRNLMTNALTHTPAGTAVAVIVSTSDGTPPQAVVEIADAGPGLAEQDAAHAFERFYRADSSRSRAGGGTGLGLAIVHGIVTAHGGTVSIDSRPGEGAIFRVSLPLTSPSFLSTSAHDADDDPEAQRADLGQRR